MTLLTFGPLEANGEKLIEELKADPALKVLTLTYERGAIAPVRILVNEDTPEAAETLRPAIQAVIDAHDPSVLTDDQQAEQEEQGARGDLRAQLFETIELYDQALANWDNLTPAQRLAINKRVVQVQRRLLIFMRRQFDQ
jgi:hypothetical protein